MTRQHIVFLTGAGVSVDSGLSTFRGKDGFGRMKSGLIWPVRMRSTMILRGAWTSITGGANIFRKWNQTRPTA